MRMCTEEFMDKCVLFHHRVNQHGGGEEVTQDFPFEHVPWLNEQGDVINDRLWQVYEDNCLHIRAPRVEEDDVVVKKYNFLTEDLKGGVNEIMRHANSLCKARPEF